MCVTQFREYCESFKHKLYDNINPGEARPYMPYKGGKNGDLYFCANLEKMKKLASSGNEYAKKHLLNK